MQCNKATGGGAFAKCRDGLSKRPPLPTGPIFWEWPHSEAKPYTE
jgi:hypothetical protein